MRDIVLTLFVFASLPLCIARPWLGILTWYWVGLMNPHRLGWGFAFDMPFAMLVGGCTIVGVLLTRERKPIPWSRELVLLLILVAYFTLTTPFAWAPDFAWPQWSKVMKIVLMTFVATMVIFGKQRIHSLLLVIALSIGFFGIKGGIFTVATGGVFRVEGPEGSFISGNTFLGLAMLMVLPVMVYVARDEKSGWRRQLLWAAAGLTTVSIAFTYSRGALIGLAAVAPLLFFNSKKKVLLAVLLLGCALLARDIVPKQLYQRAETLQAYEQDFSAMQRMQSWTVAWNVAAANPLTGAGFEFEYHPDNVRWLNFGDRKYDPYLTHSSAAHSIYFQILGQHGFVALLLFLLMLFWTFTALQRVKKQAAVQESTRWLTSIASALQIGLFGYMIAGAFLSSAYFDLMYLYVALSAVLQRELKSATVAVVPEKADWTVRRRPVQPVGEVAPEASQLSR
jgi:putative inorganic carbon (hco3(-)) transporter